MHTLLKKLSFTRGVQLLHFVIIIFVADKSIGDYGRLPDNLPPNPLPWFPLHLWIWSAIALVSLTYEYFKGIKTIVLFNTLFVGHDPWRFGKYFCYMCGGWLLRIFSITVILQKWRMVLSTIYALENIMCYLRWRSENWHHRQAIKILRMDWNSNVLVMFKGFYQICL